MGALVGQLLGRQQAARAQFAVIFGAFDGAETHRLFQRLFAPKGRESGGA